MFHSEHIRLTSLLESGKILFTAEKVSLLYLEYFSKIFHINKQIAEDYIYNVIVVTGALKRVGS